MAESTVERDFGRWRQTCDTQALGRVFDALAPELLIVAGHVAGRTSAEDLVQATFLQAIQHGDRWDAARPLLPWLVGILVRLSLRERERQRRRIDPDRLARPAAPDPREVAETEELANALSQAMHALPLTYRQTLTLRLVHGLEPTAIAHALGEPVATIKSRLQRGRELLRRALPAGLHLPAFAMIAPRSLGDVKAVVLERATAHAAEVATVAAKAATTSTTATATVTGFGVMMLMNKMTLTLAGGLALTGALAFGWYQSQEPPIEGAGEPASQPRVAATADAPTRDAGRATIDAAVDEPERVALAEEPKADTARQLVGRVVDETGAGLADVTVFLALPGRAREFSSEGNYLIARSNPHKAVETPAGGARTQSAADGAFALPAPDDEMHRVLLAWSPTRGCKLVELEAEMPSPIIIELRQGVVVTGIVRSKVDRTPVTDAYVSVYPERSGMPIAWVRTDAAGAYATPPLPLQPYRLMVDAPTFAETIVPAARGERTVDVELEPQPVLDAILVDAGGVAWTAARIEAMVGAANKIHFALTRRSYERMSELQADTFERARLTFDPATGRLTGSIIDGEAKVLSVWRGAEKIGERVLESVANERVALAIAAAPAVAVDVHVRFDPPPRQPVVAKITVADAMHYGTRLVPLGTIETRDARASLSVPEQFAGRTCALLVEAEGYVEYFTLLTVPESGSQVWHQATLQPSVATLRGRVVGPDDRPPTSATITLVNPDGSVMRLPARSSARAHDDGAFLFEGLPRRRVRLMVQVPDCAPRAIEVDTRETEEVEIALATGRVVKVVFPGGVKTRIRVLDAADRPLADDRLTGTVRFGNGLDVRVDERALTIEAYDAVTGALMDRGAIPASGDLHLDHGR